MSPSTQPPTPSTQPTELSEQRAQDDELRLSPRVELAPGVVLAERYRVVERIGMGGMATVFRAEHVDIGKPVAIKVLGEELSRKPALVRRFLQEARAASAVRHPHVVEISDFGHVREDLPFYVMEYLEGESLADRIRREGALPWPVVRRVGRQLCSALAATHRQGVIHRDMKPDNVILVEHDGEPDFVKVLDFGIAKVLSDDGPQGLTRTGVIMGTAAYMSPEQAKSQTIDARTDLYALGVMLYEMLCGRPPFEGEGVMEVLTKHIIDPVPPLRRRTSGVTPAVERVVHRALHKDREQRYASAEALAQALEDLGERGQPAAGWLPRVALVGGMAGLGALAVWGWSQRGAETPTDVPAVPSAPLPVEAPPGGVAPAAPEVPEPPPVRRKSRPLPHLPEPEVGDGAGTGASALPSVIDPDDAPTSSGGALGDAVSDDATPAEAMPEDATPLPEPEPEPELPGLADPESP